MKTSTQSEYLGVGDEMPIVKSKSLRFVNPVLALQWCFERNVELTPEQVLPLSQEEVWWLCPLNSKHYWKESIKIRHEQNTKCPFCAFRIIRKEKNLKIIYPNIAAEWHLTKNENLKPHHVLPTDERIVFWQCEHGHEWEDSIRKRVYHYSPCLECFNKDKYSLNSLALVNPVLASEWHLSRNKHLKPQHIECNAVIEVWWQCHANKIHIWKASVDSRLKGGNCPFCIQTKQKTVTLDNSSSKIIKEIHPTRNGNLIISDIEIDSDKVLWWQCSRNLLHEWTASVRDRYIRGDDCPHCEELKVRGAKFIADVNPELAKEWHYLLNDKKTPYNVTCGSGIKVSWQCKKNPEHIWESTPHTRHRYKTGCPFCTNNKVHKSNSLAALAPELAEQWHPIRNGKHTPNDYVLKSKHKAFWKCSKGHVWQACILERVLGKGCPHCYNPKLMDTKSFKNDYPKLASEWHFKENGLLTPDLIQSSYKKVVFWQCPYNEHHIYGCTIQSRINEGLGCPTCSDIRPDVNFSLGLLYPSLAVEWDRILNIENNPLKINPLSTARMFWNCSKDSMHRWKERISTRVTLDTGCPHCSKLLIVEKNNLETMAPEVAKQWHFEKNGDLKPYMVKCGSRKIVSWQCEENDLHIWEASIKSRALEGTGCPFCSGNKVNITNNLSSVYPEIAEQWDYERNGNINPETVLATSNNTSYSWKCLKNLNHRWKATVYSRTIIKTGCPYCSNRKIDQDNCLATVSPELASEWHVKRNGKTTPKDIVPGSTKYAWWRCRFNRKHIWKAEIYSRAVVGLGCPYCSNRKIDKFNCLATLFPNIAEQWHPTLNENKNPYNIGAGSDYKAIWVCEKSHTWKARVVNRTARNQGCPHCYNERRKKPARYYNFN